MYSSNKELSSGIEGSLKISLVICTYNRADILRVTLPSVFSLEVPSEVTLELIIVDNNSKDDTSKLIEELIIKNKSNIRVHYVFESQQGLSHARNTGYKHAKGDYVVYTDDECILPKQWIVEAAKKINEYAPAFLGGPYYGRYLLGSSSNWYKESYGDSYILQYDLPNGPMINRYLSGGNLFIRRDVFEKIGLFDTDLGMNGETINYGEEVEFQRRFIKKYPNEVIWYDQRVFLYHCIRDEKMKLSFLFKDALIRGASSAELRTLDESQLKKAPALLIFFALKALTSMFTKLFKSTVGKEHFFSLLYSDYKDGTWRDIGGTWYKIKQLTRKKAP